MEAVIFVGIQGAGKSTFFKERFADTHIRINLDMLRTKHREKLILEACLLAGQSFVVDKINLTRDQRDRTSLVRGLEDLGQSDITSDQILLELLNGTVVEKVKRVSQTKVCWERRSGWSFLTLMKALMNSCT